jgi:uncharacterized RDD family membrane protein YckC
MENILITTTQNVDIEHNIASVGERIGATLIDFVFFIAYGILLAVLFSYTHFSSTVAFIAFMPMTFYSLICEIAFNGQSFGKRAIGIKVVKLDGSQPSIGSYLIRWLFRIVDIWTMWGIVSIITIIINGKGQRLGDIAARTTVVRLKSKAHLQDTMYMQLDENYQMRFPQVEMLSDTDIQTIYEVYRRSRSFSDSSQLLATKTKEQLEKKLHISSDLYPIDFLNQILKDYNYLHQQQ